MSRKAGSLRGGAADAEGAAQGGGVGGDDLRALLPDESISLIPLGPERIRPREEKFIPRCCGGTCCSARGSR